ncbi:MAG: Hsp70 family protein, partial [Myxococcales bacterium]|nr:Hsp70 family protein [Myxococcales bacterium]
LEIGKDVFEVLATCGDTYLGGDDFDDRIIDLLADEFVSRHGTNLRSDIYALEKLKAAAEAAKRTLSVEEQAEIRIPDIAKDAQGKSISIERVLTTAEFESLVGDLVLRTFKVCDEALQQAGLVARDLDGVILVGGPTRLPLIRNHVRAYFQQEPRTDVDPDEVVAMGASIHAASLVGDVVTEEAAGGGAFLLDVTPLSLRIGVAGGLAETVIERNTPVPIEQTRTFTTFKDHQDSVSIRVYQGESRESAENELLGQFEFIGFEKGRRGEVEIDVTFEIDTDGIVNVTARDRSTGEEASTRITLSSGLSDTELRSIIGKHESTSGAQPSGRAAADVGEDDLHADDDIVPLRRSAAATRAAAEEAIPELETDDFEPGDEPDITGPIFGAGADAPETNVDGIETAVDLDGESDPDEPLEFVSSASSDLDADLPPEVDLDDDMAIEPDLRAARSGSSELGALEADMLDELSEKATPDGADGDTLFEAPGADLSSEDPEGT